MPNDYKQLLIKAVQVLLFDGAMPLISFAECIEKPLHEANNIAYRLKEKGVIQIGYWNKLTPVEGKIESYYNELIKS